MSLGNIGNVRRECDRDEDWQDCRDLWGLRGDTIYLNHGSFGPPSRFVQEAQRTWQRQMNEQPMDFFVRHLETAWWEARSSLAAFVGSVPQNLAFLENSTAAMNVVANSFDLTPNDEVLLTDHEYGAVLRIWQRACAAAGTVAPRVAELPREFSDADEVVSAIFRSATGRTKLLVVSHVTSPTAVILPLERICEEAKRRGIAVCVDGPHALAQLSVSLDKLRCDFYTASLHKWVSAPFGAGFLYVSPEWQDMIRPPFLSWGRLLPEHAASWDEEFIWPGTRDPTPYLASRAALQLLEAIGLREFQQRTHYLARYARQRIVELTGLEPPTLDREEWYASMVSLPLPPGDAAALQKSLWERGGIEVPIVTHLGQRSIRISCHLYTTAAQIDALTAHLATTLASES